MWDTSRWDGDEQELEANKTTPTKLRGDEALRRGGGEDTYRAEMRNVIERKVTDHSMSGYNLQDGINMRQQEESWKRAKEGEVESMGSIQPDGIFRR